MLQNEADFKDLPLKLKVKEGWPEREKRREETKKRDEANTSRKTRRRGRSRRTWKRLPHDQKTQEGKG